MVEFPIRMLQRNTSKLGCRWHLLSRERKVRFLSGFLRLVQLFCLYKSCKFQKFSYNRRFMVDFWIRRSLTNLNWNITVYVRVSDAKYWRMNPCDWCTTRWCSLPTPNTTYYEAWFHHILLLLSKIISESVYSSYRLFCFAYQSNLFT